MPTLAKPQMWWPGINRQHPLARGLVAAWPFWEGAGSKVQDVVAGNGSLDGLLTSMDPATDWVSSPYGWALRFAETGYVTSSVILGPEFTIVARLLANTTAFNLWLDYWTLQPLIESGNFDVYDSGAKVLTGVKSISAGVWYDVALTYNGTTLSQFIDGVYDASGSVSITFTGPWRLAYYSGAAYRWDGLIGRVLQYDRVLTLPEIQFLHADPYAPLRLRSRVFPAAVAPGLSIPIAMRHYLQMQGAG